MITREKVEEAEEGEAHKTEGEEAEEGKGQMSRGAGEQVAKDILALARAITAT